MSGSLPSDGRTDGRPAGRVRAPSPQMRRAGETRRVGVAGLPGKGSAARGSAAGFLSPHCGTRAAGVASISGARRDDWAPCLARRAALGPAPLRPPHPSSVPCPTGGAAWFFVPMRPVLFYFGVLKVYTGVESPHLSPSIRLVWFSIGSLLPGRAVPGGSVSSFPWLSNFPAFGYRLFTQSSVGGRPGGLHVGRCK